MQKPPFQNPRLPLKDQHLQLIKKGGPILHGPANVKPNCLHSWASHLQVHEGWGPLFYVMEILVCVCAAGSEDMDVMTAAQTLQNLFL